ncbi:hypothetical protein N1031_06190 [Herbiconiux moechotypicola]|uniref:HEPN domain-containing protein n=1 Tax=Herbiconiux moechotypicola TaxID=637393 RepID=A0ABP5QC84_9MICO|nr:hypothetical protein [Herbiconiux moechotypicola]MCS5729346.1 hypothetical protein [Herbiconiux moechotypicola]
MTPPVRPATPADAAARLRKAHEFADAAAFLRDPASGVVESADAYVTLAVHAGIAAADAICIRRGAGYNASGNHEESIGLLERADPSAAKHLRRLLGLKTKAGYAAASVSAADVRLAYTAHLALVERAQTI